jgi:hypothetical protein
MIALFGQDHAVSGFFRQKGEVEGIGVLGKLDPVAQDRLAATDGTW